MFPITHNWSYSAEVLPNVGVLSKMLGNTLSRLKARDHRLQYGRSHIGASVRVSASSGSVDLSSRAAVLQESTRYVSPKSEVSKTRVGSVDGQSPAISTWFRFESVPGAVHSRHKHAVPRRALIEDQSRQLGPTATILPSANAYSKHPPWLFGRNLMVCETKRHSRDRPSTRKDLKSMQI